MQTNKLDTSIEQALSPTELTTYFERTALQAVQQHIEELNGFVVVDGYLDAIPDATVQGWHFRVVLSDGNAANKATVLLDVPSVVLSRADAHLGDRVRVRGLLITNVYRNVLTFRIQARSVEAVDAPEEIRKLREERASIAHLKTLVGKRRPFPFKPLIKISLIYSRAGTAKVKEDFVGELEGLSQYIEIEDLPVSMSSSNDLVNAVDAATGDILVLARGGGDTEQFTVFDDPSLLEHVAKKGAYRITGVGHSANRTLLDLVVDFAASVPATAGTHVANQLNLYMAIQRENARLASNLDDLSRRHSEAVATSKFMRQKVESDLQTARERAKQKWYTWSAIAFVLGVLATSSIVFYLHH